MYDYNPNTKPIWLAIMPALLGIIAAVVVVAFVAYGASVVNAELEELKNLTGQRICFKL